MPRLIGIALLFCSLSAWASENPSLNLGDPAPALNVEKWFNGEAVTSFKPGKIYVIEFWATWCGPCVEQIPHLNEIAKKYKEDVVVIGIDTSEREKTAEEKLAKVLNFFETNDPKQEYLIGFSSTDIMHRNWQMASGSQGIPNVYVVDRDGTIAFIGHPVYLDHEKIGNPLKQIVEGTWKNSSEREKFEKSQAEQKIKQKRTMDLNRRLNAAIKAEDWNAALVVAKDGQTDGGSASYYKRLEVDLYIDNILKPELAMPLLQNLVKESWENPMELSQLIELAVHPKLITTPYYDAELARKITGQVQTFFEKDATTPDQEQFKKYEWFYYPVVAQYYAAVGDLNKAILLQKHGIQHLPDESKKHHLKKFEETLAKYEQTLSEKLTPKDNVDCEDTLSGKGQSE